MVDTVTTTMGNDNDDWEVAVDSGEFDKRLEEQDRAAKQESISSTVNNDETRSSSIVNFLNSNKPIRILKRPTSQSQLIVTNDINNTNTTAIVSDNNNNNNNLPLSNNVSSSTPVPNISIIPRNQTKDSTNSSQTISSSNISQSTKPPIKTYEQRELEYRLARLRIMGKEESSEKDDDIVPSIDSIPIKSDESIKSTSSATTLTSNNITTCSSHPSFQSHSTPGSFASNLYNLNNTSSNTGAIHFTPNTNSTGPFSQQQYRNAYPNMYPQMPLPPTTHYPTATFYMSSAPIPSSTNYPMQSSMNNWYPYHQPQQSQQQNPYGAQQYGHQQ